jgi:hypothetical protein
MLREVAEHVANVSYYAEQVGELGFGLDAVRTRAGRRAPAGN